MEVMRDIPTETSGSVFGANTVQQKRQHSRSYEYMGSGVSKRRVGSGVSGTTAAAAASFLDCEGSVSYTHLDVYKRQLTRLNLSKMDFANERSLRSQRASEA